MKCEEDCKWYVHVEYEPKLKMVEKVYYDIVEDNVLIVEWYFNVAIVHWKKGKSYHWSNQLAATIQALIEDGEMIYLGRL